MGSALVAIGLMIAADSAADPIFSWIDEQGVRHFSDTPPPESVTRFSKMESGAATQNSRATEQRRADYDQMVETYRHEAGQMEQERKLEDEQRAARKALEQRKALDDRKRSERRRLEDEIQKLRQRALSRTFSAGMRSAQIKALEEELRQLNPVPESTSPAAD